jgi:hypothetical protein
VKLEFAKEDADFAKSLSAVVRVGDDLWVGGDEGTKAVCLRREKPSSEKTLYTKVAKAEIDLVTELDLPGKARNEDGELSEVDLEGMDWDETRGYLWVVGSHSLKRNAVKPTTKKGNPSRTQRICSDSPQFLPTEIASCSGASRSRLMRTDAQR